MTTTKSFQKVNDIFQCRLILADDSEFVIPLREDGYIFATALCKVAGKRVNNWLRLKETKDLVKKVEKSDGTTSLIIEVYKGGNAKYSQGTWIHPDLGINLAQWCSPSFSLQVSKWIRELVFTDKVEIGKEKPEDEIMKALREQLNNAEQIIVSMENECRHMRSKYTKLYQTHQDYLKRKEVYKLKKGACVYLMSMADSEDDVMKIKVGYTGSITDRVSGYRTSVPHCKLLLVIYTQHNVLIESSMKIRYANELNPNNHEFITGIPFETLKNDLITIVETLKAPYSLETSEEINKFNKNIISFLEAEEEGMEIIEIDPTKLKRCGGFTHKTEESRFQTLDNFFKNAGNKDGVSRLCKECFLVGQYGDKRKRRKVVIPPRYDVLTHKWCNRCEKVKEYNLFYKASNTKDGLCPNCKECKSEQKRAQKSKSTATTTA
jgi:hypothetical protein